MTKNEAMTNTGLYDIARQKPIRPINSTLLLAFGFITIGLSLTATYAAFYAHNFVAAGCASAGATLALWGSVAFLWHSVRQLNEKVKAITTLLESEGQKLVKMTDTLNRIEAYDPEKDQ